MELAIGEYENVSGKAVAEVFLRFEYRFRNFSHCLHNSNQEPGIV
jgi:hypothetical protein